MEKTGTGNIAASHPLYESKGPHYSPISAKVEEVLQSEAMISLAKSDQRATWVLADYFLPADVKEFFERHGMLATGSEIWRTAFVTGFKVSLRGSIKDKE